MSEIADLQARITSALDRIGSGLEGLEKPTDGGSEDRAEIARLQTALDDERTANAQLEARVSAIKEKQEKTVNTLASEVERLRALLQAEEAMIARLSKVNSELRTNNNALRNTITAGLPDAHLINKAMMAELESLRATQAADRAELDAILAELTPLVEETRNRVEAATDEETTAAFNSVDAPQPETAPAGGAPDLAAIIGAVAGRDGEDEEHTDA